jgi:hypothetical protein
VRMFVRAILASLTTILLVFAARPAAAELTVITHYTLVSGDTLTRAAYYTPRRIRVTAPDGKEFMFDSKTDTLTVIDHAGKRYWQGLRNQADSIATRIMNSNREGVPETAKTDPVAWADTLEAFNKSIHVEATEKRQKIAGYPCDEWVLTAGKYLRVEQWIARSLVVNNYGPEVQKAVMATIKDPLGRALMRLLLGMRTKEGLVLNGRVTFLTLKQEGSFHFEAVKVISASVPKTAWIIPDGYTKVQL